MATNLSIGMIQLPSRRAAKKISTCYSGKMPPRRAYHHGSLREAVLASAAKLVDDGELLGLRELGRRGGVSHGAAPPHFPPVDGLAAELAATWFGDLDRARAAAADAIPPGKPL